MPCSCSRRVITQVVDPGKAPPAAKGKAAKAREAAAQAQEREAEELRRQKLARADARAAARRAAAPPVMSFAEQMRTLQQRAGQSTGPSSQVWVNDAPRRVSLTPTRPTGWHSWQQAARQASHQAGMDQRGSAVAAAAHLTPQAGMDRRGSAVAAASHLTPRTYEEHDGRNRRAHAALAKIAGASPTTPGSQTRRRLSLGLTLGSFGGAGRRATDSDGGGANRYRTPDRSRQSRRGSKVAASPPVDMAKPADCE